MHIFGKTCSHFRQLSYKIGNRSGARIILTEACVIYITNIAARAVRVEVRLGSMMSPQSGGLRALFQQRDKWLQPGDRHDVVPACEVLE